MGIKPCELSPSMRRYMSRTVLTVFIKFSMSCFHSHSFLWLALPDAYWCPALATSNLAGDKVPFIKPLRGRIRTKSRSYSGFAGFFKALKPLARRRITKRLRKLRCRFLR